MTCPAGSALSISDLTLIRNGTKILSNVGLEVHPGDFLCVIGPNGAGKSSLLRCVAGIHHDYSGDIRLGGVKTERLSARELARNIALVPQSTPTELPFTVREFIGMARYPWRSLTSAAVDEQAADEAARMTGVEALADRRISTLSGGERQKVLLAAAIAQETKIVLLDEPATFLDYAHQGEMARLICNINRERGASIVMVTHDVNFALSYASGVLALCEGEAIWAGPSGELLAPGRLRRIYGVDFEQYYPGSGGASPIVAPIDEGVQ